MYRALDIGSSLSRGGWLGWAGEDVLWARGPSGVISVSPLGLILWCSHTPNLVSILGRIDLKSGLITGN